MKRGIRLINYLFLAASPVMAALYYRIGGLPMKAASAAVFALLGLINSAYAVKMRRYNPVYMLLALLLCMTADIVLGYSFLAGAGIFALGHVLFFIAFSRMEKLKWGDLLPGLILFIPAALWLITDKRFRFRPAAMEYVCIGYALVISLMMGKATANLLRNRNAAYLLLTLGCGLFVVSDIMLVLHVFGRGPRWTDTVCLFTYFPGQCITAHAMMHLAEGRNRTAEKR